MTERQAVRPALAAQDWDRLAKAPLPELDGEYPLNEAQVEGFRENGFIVLEEVLDRAEITAYGEAIRDVAMAHFRSRGLALSFGGAFLQQLNLRYCSDAVRSFVLSPRFGRIASRLLRTPAVRLYHEQALFKPPGGTDSHWHQDQFYFPFDDTFTMGLWMPLVDCSLDMGPLRFVAGSHKYGNLEGMSISEGVETLLRRLRRARGAGGGAGAGAEGGRLFHSLGLDRARRAGQSLRHGARGDDRQLLPGPRPHHRHVALAGRAALRGRPGARPARRRRHEPDRVLGKRSGGRSEVTGQWSAERANEWFASIPLPFGCNFLPSTAVNSTEMWQADTFDPATIERELQLAAGLGYNTVRVFLQFMVWEADPADHNERLKTFLRLADAAGITMMPILFDDCRFDDRDP